MLWASNTTIIYAVKQVIGLDYADSDESQEDCWSNRSLQKGVNVNQSYELWVLSFDETCMSIS